MRLIIKLITYCSAALVLGLLSAWYMITVGSALTLQNIGPWSTWINAGNPEADPYTRAHFARSGRLPVTSTSARYYVAFKDSNGSNLDADCEYEISGPDIPSSWWSIAVYDRSGAILPNKAKRYSFNKANVTFETDGGYKIVASPLARTGNWLPLSGGGSLQLMLRIYRGDTTEALLSLDNAASILPKIKRVDC